jgi:methylthioribulose-1-phosphate dehydratase
MVLERDPLRLAITASSVDKGHLSPEQILEVDSRGEAVGNGGKPSAETLLHLQIARDARAEAVFHTHSIWSTVLSDIHRSSGGLIIEGYEMLKGLEGVPTHEHREWIPILQNSQDMSQLSTEVGRVLAEHPASHGFLVHRHGLYTWGKDAAAAARHIEILEFLLEAVGRSYTLQPNGPMRLS